MKDDDEYELVEVKNKYWWMSLIIALLQLITSTALFIVLWRE